MNAPFRLRPHGLASFVVRDRVVVLSVKGPWNAELVVQCHDDLHEVLTQLKPHQWGMMVVVSGSAMFGPDAKAAIRNIARSQTETMGRAATAWVLPPDVEGATFMPSIIESLYGGSERMRIFETEAPAEAWLNERLSM